MIFPIITFRAYFESHDLWTVYTVIVIVKLNYVQGSYYKVLYNLSEKVCGLPKLGELQYGRYNECRKTLLVKSS